MHRIVITAQVNDAAKWEEGFRTHGGLLGTMSQSRTYLSTNNANEIALYSEPKDLEKFMKVMESPENIEAMAIDGVKPDTVRMFVMDEVFVY
jgi:hypothetical protein